MGSTENDGSTKQDARGVRNENKHQNDKDHENEQCKLNNIAVPPLWNKLPPALRQLSDPSYELTKTPPLAISPQLFHPKLKPLFFNKSYPDLSSSPYLPSRLNSKLHPQ